MDKHQTRITGMLQTNAAAAVGQRTPPALAGSLSSGEAWSTTKNIPSPTFTCCKMQQYTAVRYIASNKKLIWSTLRLLTLESVSSSPTSAQLCRMFWVSCCRLRPCFTTWSVHSGWSMIPTCYRAYRISFGANEKRTAWHQISAHGIDLHSSSNTV